MIASSKATCAMCDTVVIIDILLETEIKLSGTSFFRYNTKQDSKCPFCGQKISHVIFPERPKININVTVGGN